MPKFEGFVVVWVLFAASTGTMLAAVIPKFSYIHLYDVVENQQNYIIKMGIMGYCLSKVFGNGTTGKCRGPPNRIGWTLKSVGNYLDHNSTSWRMEDLRRSITPPTTRVLLVNFILLGSSALGFIFSLWGIIVKKVSIRRFLTILLFWISITSLVLSLVTPIINHIFGIKIGQRIKAATYGSLQLKLAIYKPKMLSLLIIPIIFSLLAAGVTFGMTREEPRDNGIEIFEMRRPGRTTNAPPEPPHSR